MQLQRIPGWQLWLVSLLASSLSLYAGCGGSPPPSEGSPPAPPEQKSFQPTPSPPGPVKLTATPVTAVPQTEEWYAGEVIVGLTDAPPPSGTYVLMNVFRPTTAEIFAIVQIPGARAGLKVTGRWYQMGVLQPNQQNAASPEGALISEATFTMSGEAINTQTGIGAGLLTMRPNAPLPLDSYLLKVYVDDKLARTLMFVVQDAAGRSSRSFAQAVNRQLAIGLSDESLELTGMLPPLLNVLRPQRDVLATIRIENAREGMHVTTQWLRMATTQFPPSNMSPEGAPIAVASISLTREEVDPASKRAVIHVFFREETSHIEDSYLLRVYLDGKLIQILGFVEKS